MTREELEKHLLDGESVIASIKGVAWNWYCTDYRILLYNPRDGENWDEEEESVMDLSFRDVTSVRYGVDVEEESIDNRDSIILGIIAAVLILAAGSGELPNDWNGIAAIGALISLIAAVLDYDSGPDRDVKPELALRGRGYLAGDDWSIVSHEDVNQEEVRRFAKAVRAKITGTVG